MKEIFTPVPETAAALAAENYAKHGSTIKDALMRALADHYWDSLEPHKDLILKHVEGALRSFISPRTP